MLPKDGFLYPHEVPKKVSTEAHFQRTWALYRAHVLKSKIEAAVQGGKLSSTDASQALHFLLDKKGRVNITPFCLGFMELRKDLKDCKYFKSACAALTACDISFGLSKLTAEPFESQFWNQYDTQLALTEDGLHEALPSILGHSHHLSHGESSKQLAH